MRKYFNISLIDPNARTGGNMAKPDGTPGIGGSVSSVFPHIIAFSDGLWVSVWTSERELSYFGAPSILSVTIITVDINSDEKPNAWGRDIFMLALKNDGKIVGFES